MMKFFVFAFALILLARTGTEGSKSGAGKPNILLVLADDQDVVLNGMEPMKQVRQLLGEEGVTFSHAYTSSPICCPARASLLSGMYAHNHKTTNNSISGGCYGHYWQEHVEPKALPVALQNHGYETFFAGKYLNQYYDKKVPPGWDDFHGLHGNSKYYNYTLNQNGKLNNFTEEYLTDHLKELTLNFLEKPRKLSKPFFAMVSVPAPHAPFTPAPRHQGIYAGLQAIRTPNFNKESSFFEKHWLVSSSKEMTNKTIDLIDQYFQQRWESLLSVDELLQDVIQKLELLNELSNTYVIYTSDNGYHVGQFAMPFDKRQPYETDIKVPLLIRGPNVPKGLTISTPVSLIDIFPTILEWAQLPFQDKMDGFSFNVYISNAFYYESLQDPQYRRSLLIEYWGEGNSNTYNPECPQKQNDNLAECTIETDCHCQDSWNNTYACVRHLRYRTDRLYCEFKDHENFLEAYDHFDDPYQMKNIVYDLLPIEQALYNLALANLTKCSGSSCNDVII